jgi:hypothetical protein
MALPSRDQTFAYANCRDLLEKLDREIDRYCEVAGSDLDYPGEMLLRIVDQLKDSAFNASVTAWQVCDWVFNDLPIEQRQKLGFKRLLDLQNHVRKQCRALHLCRQAATASKHWSVKKHPDIAVKIIVTGDPVWTIYFVDGDKKIKANQVFNEAYHFWTGFIRDNGIAKALDDREIIALQTDTDGVTV